LFIGAENENCTTPQQSVLFYTKKISYQINTYAREKPTTKSYQSTPSGMTGLIFQKGRCGYSWR
jgi:hypothetical protein